MIQLLSEKALEQLPSSQVADAVSHEPPDTPVLSSPDPSYEHMRQEDALAAAMVSGIISVAFLVLVILMVIVNVWTFSL